MANFGDRAIGGYGQILGGVELWEDDGEGLEPTGDGVPGVEIYLNSGERDTTDDNGAFSFYVPATSYTVSMVVPDGYMVVGPLSIDKTLAADGDTALVVFGLAVAGLVGWVAGVHAVERLFQGEPVRELLSQLFVFGILGLSGTIVFIQCLRSRGWARRTASVAAIMFLAIIVAQPFTGYGLLGGRPAVSATFLAGQLPGLILVVLCAAVGA